MASLTIILTPALVPPDAAAGLPPAAGGPGAIPAAPAQRYGQPGPGGGEAGL